MTDVALSAFKSYDAVHGDVAVGNGAVDRVAVATSIVLLYCYVCCSCLCLCCKHNKCYCSAFNR